MPSSSSLFVSHSYNRKSFGFSVGVFTVKVKQAVMPGLVSEVASCVSRRILLAWHVSSHSGEACCELLYSVCLYLYLTHSDLLDKVCLCVFFWSMHLLAL